MPRNIDDLQEEYERYTELAKQHFEVADFYLSIVRDQLHQMNEYFDGLDSAFTIEDVFKNVNSHLLETQIICKMLQIIWEQNFLKRAMTKNK